MPVDKIELVKTVVRAWANNELTSSQAMFNVTVIVGSREPSSECTEWAEGVISNGS